jgi:hypothetical protein
MRHSLAAAGTWEMGGQAMLLSAEDQDSGQIVEQNGTLSKNGGFAGIGLSASVGGP